MKKFLALALATIFCASMLVVSVPAAEVANPTKILEESTFVTKTVVSFDEADIADRATGASPERTTWEFVDGIGAKGKALKMTNGNNTSEGNIIFEEQDWSMYDGLLWYVDLSGVVYNADKVAAGELGGAPLRLFSNFASGYTWTRNTATPVLENFDIATYYLENGSTEWKKSDNTKMNGERFNLPQYFKGWVYVPFTSFISTKGPEGTPVAGLYGAEAISKIMILSGPHDNSAEVAKTVVVVDEIQLVKLGTTTPPDATTAAPDTTAPDTTAPDTTTPDTKAPDTATPETTTKVETTAAPATEAPAKKGCGSSITVASVAVVMTAVLGSALVIKKRR